jgi:basic membrane protein A
VQRVLGKVAILFSVLIAISACGGGSPAASTKLKAVLIENQQPGDKGAIDLHITGLTLGAKDLGYDVKNVYVADVAQFEPTLRQFAALNYNLIITTFPPMNQATINVAKDYPNVHFVNTDGPDLTSSQIPSNMQVLDAADGQGTFLAGALAGLMTKTNKIGFFSGPENGVIDRWESGYIQGALAVNPAIKEVAAYVDSYSDPVQGKEAALRLYNSGVDVIGLAGSGSDLGVDQAAESNPSTWHVVTMDGLTITGGAPHSGYAAITSRFDNWVYGAMKAVKAGTFAGGPVYLGLKDGAWTITEWNTATVPQNMQSKVEALQQQIISGQIVVNGAAALPTLKKQVAP